MTLRLKKKKRTLSPLKQKASPLLVSLVFGSLFLHSLLIFFPFLALFFLVPQGVSSLSKANKVASYPSPPSSDPAWREDGPPKPSPPPSSPFREEVPLKPVQEVKVEVQPMAYHPLSHPRKKNSLFPKGASLPPIDRFAYRSALASKRKSRRPQKSPAPPQKSPPQKASSPTKEKGPIKTASQNQGRPDAQPQVVYRVKRYPSRCRRRNHEGQVVLEAWIDGEGICQKVRILSSEGCSRLMDAAVESARESRYQPGRQSGKKVGQWKKLIYTFRLR